MVRYDMDAHKYVHVVLLCVASNGTAVWFYVVHLFHTVWLPIFPDSIYIEQVNCSRIFTAPRPS